MASPRSASPSEASSPPSPQLLTPRSKLKQMFAGIDSSSDEDTSKDGGSKSKKSSSKLPTFAARKSSPAETPSLSSSDEEDEIVRPRGRLASRMQAGNASKPNTTDVRKSLEPQEEVDARERVKMLLQKPEEPIQTAEQDDVEDGAEAEDEGDDVIARPRKLVNRARRSETPKLASPAPREESPMFLSPDKLRSPTKPTASDNSDSEDEFPADITKTDRFQALVAKKRAERLAREAEEERKRAARRAAQEAAAAQDDLGDDEDSDITDDDGGRKLTQESRPARKAGKKALEEMNRETQRISRNMQLAHEAKTRKKITKASLFERFNFRPEGAGSGAEDKPLNSSSRPSTPVSTHDADVEMVEHQTPPSSPPALGKEPSPAKAVEAQGQQTEEPTIAPQSDDEMPSLDDVVAAAIQKRLDKGKAVATDDDFEALKTKKPAPKRRFKVKLPTPSDALISLEDSDEDKKTAVSKKNRKLDAIFNRATVKQEHVSRSLMVMRQFAQVTSPAKAKSGKASMTTGELQFSLQQRARAQAKMERDRRLEQLKARGVHIQTEEERDKERMEIEDIVGRARLEAEEIMQRERDAAKKEKKEKGEDAEADPLAWDDSDASWDEDGDADEKQVSEIELSGSDDDEDMDVDEEDGEKTGMFDDEAESADDSEDQEPEEPEEDVTAEGMSDDDVPQQVTKPSRRNKKQLVVMSDDEEDEPMVAKTPKSKPFLAKSTPSVQRESDSPQVPTSVLRSANKTFIPGFPVAAGAPAGLGLTQMFAGTMGSSPAGSAACSPSQPMPTFEGVAFPDSQFSQNAAEAPADEMILDSQRETQEAETQGVQLHYTQSQMHGFDTQFATQMSEMIEPSQDGGYQQYTPLKERFIEAPPSTVQTVMLDPTQQPDVLDSPLAQRRGKLRRKASVLAIPPIEEDDEAEEAAEAEDEASDADLEDQDNAEAGDGATTAFSLMKDAAAREKRRLKAFNKKKSKAKEMVEDQAMESEDEYAGLGGVDGEDSDDESSASVKDMIDDQAGMSKEDKAKIAAFYADRERANDEKAVEKLFRDITSGMLRRKRRNGEGYDGGGLSDSDDGGEARRRMKRRQFARMQKALFADERVSKVAENPRNRAFLRTIEDHGSDDDDVMDFLFQDPSQAAAASASGTTDESQPATETRPESAPPAQVAIPDSQPPIQPAARLPAPQRRTKEGRKPSNIGEIRESLSNLLDDPHASIITATDLGSDSDGDDAQDEPSSSNKENRNPRRTRREDVVDRVSLRRQGSSSMSSVSGGRMAFATAGASGNGVRGVPALLRRATTNSLKSSGSSTGTASNSLATAGGFGKESKIHKTAGKRSGVNYFARENDRLAAMAEKEKRREARKFKGAEGRGKVVGGLFGGGKFE